MFDTITKQNWLLYAMQNYDNPLLKNNRSLMMILRGLNILKGCFANMKQQVN